MRNLSAILLLFLFVISSFAQQSVKVGTSAPDFVVESTNGEVFDLQELKGKIVVITFWSTSCEICKLEIPKLNKLSSDYKDVVFLAMTTDQGERLNKFLDKYPFKFNIIQNSFGIFLKYADIDKAGKMTMGYPAYFIVNQTGEVVLKAEGIDHIDKISTKLNLLSVKSAK